MTHKKELDSFTKQLKTMGKVPCALADFAVAGAKQKSDLFGMWLDSGKDWHECQMMVERKQKQQHEAEKGWCAIQGRELIKKYEDEPGKAEKLMELRKNQGLWYEDEDWPGDMKEPRCLFTK